MGQSSLVSLTAWSLIMWHHNIIDTVTAGHTAHKDLEK